MYTLHRAYLSKGADDQKPLVERVITLKFDPDLAREILIQVENHPTFVGWVNIQVPDRTELEIWYHIKMLHQAGLVEAESSYGAGQSIWFVTSLTYQGHEFLNMARNDTFWAKAKKKVLDTVGSLTIDLLKEALKGTALAEIMSGS